ncbi:MAG: helix-hairpin-helix domain-containing protein [Bacteroidales bacterium]|nr:helix-hairpin-helix domain-containing protein [Bacteroidales bacterium]
MTNSPDHDRKHQTSTSFTVGAIALIFLAIGYQTALFIHKAAVATVVANHDRPDTVYVFGSPPDDWSYDHGTMGTDGAQGHDGSGSNDGRARYHGTGNSRQYQNGRQSQGDRQYRTVRRSAEHSDAARKVVQEYGRRSYESFPFDPNTVSIDDLMRLGFSQKQARSIDNYRQSGGRFRRKEDFAKSYVVADSVYRRLEQFIQIPKLDINKADSTAFDTLPGIGAYYASRMVSYRERLGGYSFPEQLMDIPRFDQEKYDQLKDLITVGPAKPYPLWTMPEDSLARHPYLDRHSAHSIVLFRDNSPRSEWTVEALVRAGILSGENGRKLLRCRIAAPAE